MIDYEKIREIIDVHDESVEFGSYGEGTSREWIRKAEERLGIKFPLSYVWWLSKYGGGEIYGDEVFSVYGMDFDTVVGGDIVYMNELNRKNGRTASAQLAIMENDQGESYYLALNEVDDDGENPVYVNGKRYADSFADFLIRYIDSD
ncbi:hypothetical protein FUAX_53770 (plasmid) [Fulvitalea axinellae]|uniref:Knr4/Smi1-like domain-containing protein n=1 Tax=Fulvitalea axinellae TaxID=1182444 RepID=A0AAU9DK86_9BACT|nr:hypothetical protein FUAX_53770 [Fulvitalea axinellae]